MAAIQKLSHTMMTGLVLTHSQYCHSTGGSSHSLRVGFSLLCWVSSKLGFRVENKTVFGNIHSFTDYYVMFMWHKL